MKSRIGSVAVEEALVAVAPLVLGVAHLVVDDDEVCRVDPGALLDPVVLAVIKVPGGRVANQVPAVSWFLDDAAVPELLEVGLKLVGDLWLPLRDSKPRTFGLSCYCFCSLISKTAFMILVTSKGLLNNQR